MFQPGLISPVTSVRGSILDQVKATNEFSGGIPPLDLPRYLSRQKIANLGFMYDNASEVEKPGFLIEQAKEIIGQALVMQYRLDPNHVEDVVARILEKPEAHPSNAFNANTVSHLDDYFQFAYLEVCSAIFAATCEMYTKYAQVHFPVDKLDYLPLAEIIAHMENPERQVTREETDLVFQREPMISFLFCNQLLNQQFADTVARKEDLMLIGSFVYQGLKKIIFDPEKQKVAKTSAEDFGGGGKTLKISLRNKVLSK